MEKNDLRKETIQALRRVEGEIEGVILLATNCKKTAEMIKGSHSDLVSMLAIAMIDNPELIQLIKDAFTVALIAKMDKSEI